MFNRKPAVISEADKLTIVIEYLEARKVILSKLGHTARQRREIDLELNLLRSKKLLLNGTPVLPQ